MITFYPARSLTERALEITREWNKTAFLGSRLLGLGVAIVSFVEIIRELGAALGALTNRACGACGVKWQIESIDKSELYHLRLAGRHTLGVITALVFGAIAPEKLLLPAMKRLGFDIDGPAMSLKKMALTGIGLICTAVTTRLYGAQLLSAARTALAGKKLPPPPAFTWPPVWQIALGIFGGNVVAMHLVAKSTVGPLSGRPLKDQSDRAKEVPLFGSATAIMQLILVSVHFAGGRLFGFHNYSVKQFVGFAGNVAVGLVPFATASLNRAGRVIPALTTPTLLKQYENVAADSFWSKKLEAEIFARAIPLDRFIEQLTYRSEMPKREAQGSQTPLATVAIGNMRYELFGLLRGQNPLALYPIEDNSPFKLVHGIQGDFAIEKLLQDPITSKDFGWVMLDSEAAQALIAKFKSFNVPDRTSAIETHVRNWKSS